MLLFGVLLSEFGSNTASASILIPILLGSNIGTQHLSLTLVVCGVAFAASFGFMLPVSTPPNAIVFGTGKLKLSDMIRAGVLFDLLGIILIFIYIGIFLPLIQ
jgi:sodium-dependent dicarboxylate transporter 2/3/5